MYSLLIVDDEAYIVDGPVQLFEDSDLPLKRIASSYSATNALEMIARHPYDIIISDIKMPGLDGLTFLEQVRRTNPRTRFILLTGYDYFEYARKAIHLQVQSYLLKPVEDDDVIANVARVIAGLDVEMQEALAIWQMQETLGKGRIRAQSHLIELLLKDSADIQDILTRTAYELPFRTERDIGLVGIRISGPHKNDSEQIDRVLAMMRSLFTRLTEGELILQKESAAMAVGIFQTPEQYRGNFLSARFEEIQDYLHHELGIISSLSIIRDFPWEELRQNYRNMLVYLRLNIQQGQILQVESHITYMRDERLMSLLEDMTEAIRGTNRGRFMECLDRVVSLSSGREQFNGGLAYFYLSLSQFILGTAFDNNITALISTENIEKLTNLSSFDSIDEFKAFLIHTYDMLEKDLTGNEHPSNQLISSIQYYICNNLDKELSLDYLAQKFRINASYLSRVFREVTKQNISNYISVQKVARAKQLLAESSCRIGDIAERLGYQNQNYFAKVFRKIAGISPQEYRQAAREK